MKRLLSIAGKYMSKEVLSDRSEYRTFLEELLAIADEGVVVHDDSGKIVFYNPAAERILGLSEERILGQYSTDFDPATFREDGSPFPAEEHPAAVTLRTGKPCNKVVMGLEWRPESPVTWLSISSAIIPPVKSRSKMVVAVFADITPQIEAKRTISDMMAALQNENRSHANTESFMRGLLNAIPDRVWVKDPNGIYLFCNSALAKVYQVAESTVIGKTDYDFWPRQQADAFSQSDAEAIRGNTLLKIESVVFSDRYREEIVLETAKVPILDRDGQLLGVLGIARDVTERLDLIKQLRKANRELRDLANEQALLAHTDPLTRLPNRRAFEKAIGPAFEYGKVSSTPTSILLIDIDYFKSVNDCFGHEAGDAALIHLAKTLLSNSRASDLAARVGGDEFALLLPNTANTAAKSLAKRLREEIELAELVLCHKRFRFSISIGVSSFYDSDFEWTVALKRADKALYEAKENRPKRSAQPTAQPEGTSAPFSPQQCFLDQRNLPANAGGLSSSDDVVSGKH